jgi:hypothetical protein
MKAFFIASVENTVKYLFVGQYGTKFTPEAPMAYRAIGILSNRNRRCGLDALLEESRRQCLEQIKNFKKSKFQQAKY